MPYGVSPVESQQAKNAERQCDFKCPKEITLGRTRWTFTKALGDGTYGSVFLAHSADKKLKLAIKFQKGEGLEIEEELKVYNAVSRRKPVPGILVPRMDRLIHAVSDDDSHVEITGLALPLANKGNLHALWFKESMNWDEATRRTNLACVAFKLMEILEGFHKAGYVHRDFKPENILCHELHKMRYIYLADMGFAASYKNKNGQHVSAVKDDGNKLGTWRYASLMAHDGYLPSRAMDLCGLIYILVYLHDARLPWVDLKEETAIAHVKRATTHEALTATCPSWLKTLAPMLLSLQHGEVPDYRTYLDLICLYLNPAREHYVHITSQAKRQGKKRKRGGLPVHRDPKRVAKSPAQPAEHLGHIQQPDSKSLAAPQQQTGQMKKHSYVVSYQPKASDQRIESNVGLEELQRGSKQQWQSGYRIKTVCCGELPASWTAVYEPGLEGEEQQIVLYSAEKLRRGSSHLSRQPAFGYEITSAAGAFEGEDAGQFLIVLSKSATPSLGRGFYIATNVQELERIVNNMQGAVGALAVAPGRDGTDVWLVAFSHHRSRGDAVLQLHDLATFDDFTGLKVEKCAASSTKVAIVCSKDNTKRHTRGSAVLCRSDHFPDKTSAVDIAKQRMAVASVAKVPRHHSA